MNTKPPTIAACFLTLVLFLAACGKLAWPAGTGYVTPAAHRPASPVGIQTQKTDWEIYTCETGSQCEGEGEIEIKGGQTLAFATGAVITNRSTSQKALTLMDQNGDRCIIPYGMTVRIDEYGQFVPVKYNPNLAPPAQ